MSVAKKRVAIFPPNPAAFGEYLILAKAILAEGTFQPIIIFKRDSENWMRVCQEAGLETYIWQPVTLSLPPVFTARVFEYLLKYLRGGLWAWLKLLWSKRFQAQQHLHHAAAFFETHAPSAILAGDDRGLGMTAALLHLADLDGCPFLVIPYAELTDKHVLAQNRLNKSAYLASSAPQKSMKWFLERIYPNYLHPVEGQQVFFYEPNDILVYASLGLLPDDPWLVGRYGTALGLIGQEALDIYLRDGGKSEKVHLVGLPSFDSLYTTMQNEVALRHQICQKYGLDSNQKIIICALPQLGEHHLIDWETHLHDTHFLVKTLSEVNDAQLLISLHPRMQRATYQFLEETYPVYIVGESLRDILAIADLFVAANSSTVTWATLLKIPAIVVDFHRLFSLDQYSKHTSVRCIHQYEVLKPTAETLLAAEASYSFDSADYITQFDGKSNQRIIDLIKMCVGL